MANLIGGTGINKMVKKVYRIGVDASWRGSSGIGRVAAEVIDRCPDGWDIVEIRQGKRNASPLTPFELAVGISRVNADLFWSPGFMPPAYCGGTPIVLTVHDLTHLHYYNSFRRMYYNVVIKPLLKKSACVITVSDFSKRELLSWSGIREDRIVRVYNGVSREFSPIGPKEDIGCPYVLYVGNRRSYKNVIRLMEAFSKSDLSSRGLVLALTGTSDEICRQAEDRFNLQGLVYYFGYVPEAGLASVYRGAQALAFVSLYEGFGLPILEAMACGVPVLTSDVSSMPEIGGGAAYLVNPGSVDSITRGLRRIVLDDSLREQLIKKGIHRANDFSWDMTASQYWQTFSRLVV